MNEARALVSVPINPSRVLREAKCVWPWTAPPTWSEGSSAGQETQIMLRYMLIVLNYLFFFPHIVILSALEPYSTGVPLVEYDGGQSQFYFLHVSNVIRFAPPLTLMLHP